MGTAWARKNEGGTAAVDEEKSLVSEQPREWQGVNDGGSASGNSGG